MKIGVSVERLLLSFINIQKLPFLTSHFSLLIPHTLFLIHHFFGETDHLEVALEDGGDTEGFVGHIVAVVFGEGVVDETVDILWIERKVGHVLHEAFHAEATAVGTQLTIMCSDEGKGV